MATKGVVIAPSSAPLTSSNSSGVVYNPDISFLSGNQNKGQGFSPAYVVVLGILVAAILLVIYYYCFVIHFNTTLCFMSREQSRRGRRVAMATAGAAGVGGLMYSNGAFVIDIEGDGTEGGAANHTNHHQSNASGWGSNKKGLDEMAIQSIPMYRYHRGTICGGCSEVREPKKCKRGEGEEAEGKKKKKSRERLSDGGSRGEEEGMEVNNNNNMMNQMSSSSSMDCAVCLGSFREEDMLRKLPACQHAFHVGCVDTWLYSCSECPLCRTHVLVPPPPPDASAAAASSYDQS